MRGAVTAFMKLYGLKELPGVFLISLERGYKVHRRPVDVLLILGLFQLQGERIYGMGNSNLLQYYIKRNMKIPPPGYQKNNLMNIPLS